MTRLVDARWPEVQASGRVLIVPVGALEQHGPHLPLDTDSVIASAVAERLHGLRPAAGLAPVLPVGASGEHADFPGTMSIGTEALRSVLVELVRHAVGPWAAVLFVNGHGGNREALRAAAVLCGREGRCVEVAHLGAVGMDAHAGRAETSLMLHLQPERVRVDLAEPGVTDGLATLLPALVSAGVRAVSPNGVLGNPVGATAAEGARWFDELVASTVAAYDRCRRVVSGAEPPL